MSEAVEEIEKTGVRPRVNEAKEFIEIAKDFKRPQEILREALSNSWDAHAAAVNVELEAITVLRPQTAVMPCVPWR